jgi:hypothetical protein
MPLEVGESRGSHASKCSHTVCSEKMPVSILPRRTKALIARQPQLQEWHKGWSKNEESHNLTVAGNRGVALQEEVADREWSGHHLA